MGEVPVIIDVDLNHDGPCIEEDHIVPMLLEAGAHLRGAHVKKAGDFAHEIALSQVLCIFVLYFTTLWYCQ